MPYRLNTLRSLLAVVLIAVTLLAAFAGATEALRSASSGLHAPHHQERLEAQRIGDVRATAGGRQSSPDGTAGTMASAQPLVASASVALTARRAPRDWRKLSSGLVPLPLRI